MEQLSPEKAVAMLKKEGMEISVEEAALVLAFLRKLADMVVESYLDKHWGRDKTDR